MYKKLMLASLAITLNTNAMNSLESANNTLLNAPAHIKNIMNSAPATYNYTSKFSRSSSVSYTGQAFRQVLINDIKSYMTSLKRGGHDSVDTLTALNSYFAYNENTDAYIDEIINGDSIFKVKAKGLDGQALYIYEGDFYSDIQSPGKNLSSKIAGNDNPLRRKELKGWSSFKVGNIDLRKVNADNKGDSFAEPEDLVQAFFQTISNNAENGQAFSVKNGDLEIQRVSGAYITEDGLDLAQLVQKTFHGAVSYSQAAGDYLATTTSVTGGLNSGNTTPDKPGKAYTSMEHHFDEAFGYFGAARDYNSYTDVQIASKLSIDTNNDGEISVLSELNQGLSTNFSRMDLIAKNYGFEMDLSGNTMTAFIQGRQLITKAPADYKKYVVALANKALGNWEKTLAAVTIHYINSTISQMDAYGTKAYLFTNHAKFWSEMKGFALSFQFSPVSIMSDAQFDELHTLLADKPALHKNGLDTVVKYKSDLTKARELLNSIYAFPTTSSNW
ncbi:DUF4856 domain-containing protein [Halobacteriovorax sp. HLS]|uniref:DUF4856 domain-containing protein n=1 Tax=Halobacteriovorax sp. HLS TaxID=2234000 RepID=UPI000FD7F0D9|nr:DUF4856 domain-containing protein [Halobacteriovorax sp. HLS]